MSDFKPSQPLNFWEQFGLKYHKDNLDAPLPETFSSGNICPAGRSAEVLEEIKRLITTRFEKQGINDLVFEASGDTIRYFRKQSEVTA